MNWKKHPSVSTTFSYSSLLTFHPGWLGQESFVAKLPPPSDCSLRRCQRFHVTVTPWLSLARGPTGHLLRTESERVCWLQGLAGAEEDWGREDAGADDRGHLGRRAVPHAGLHPVLQLPAQWGGAATAEDRRRRRLQRIFKGNPPLGSQAGQPRAEPGGRGCEGTVGTAVTRRAISPSVSKGNTNVAKNFLIALRCLSC